MNLFSKNREISATHEWVEASDTETIYKCIKCGCTTSWKLEPNIPLISKTCNEIIIENIIK